ncbi:hypothetical protein AB0L14_28215 [Streptomyces sp. NPDC052727]|uniref:hypothetical protein n=1 Tax=Streptomyces sp. NPDC052727 TaxID=3154854 RepID=UPI003427D57E
MHLIAHDTQALDVALWVHDPLETMLRTNLGGGTHGTAAMACPSRRHLAAYAHSLRASAVPVASVYRILAEADPADTADGTE